jgi:hypothetical protein
VLVFSLQKKERFRMSLIVEALRAASGGSVAASNFLTDPVAKTVVSVTGLALAFVANLVEHGLDPDAAVEEVQEVMTDYLEAKKRLQKKVDELSSTE